MAISTTTLAQVRQSYEDAESLTALTHGIEVYLEATEGHSSYESFLESDDMAGYKALLAATALHWFKSADAPPSVKEDVLRSVEAAIEERPWIEEGLNFKPVERNPEFEAMLRPHSDNLLAYFNACLQYGSFEEYLKAVPDAEPVTLDATRSMQWVLFEADWPSTLAEERFLHGCSQCVDEYPWLETGLRWGAKELEGQAA